MWFRKLNKASELFNLVRWERWNYKMCCLMPWFFDCCLMSLILIFCNRPLHDHLIRLSFFCAHSHHLAPTSLSDNWWAWSNFLPHARFYHNAYRLFDLNSVPSKMHWQRMRLQFLVCSHVEHHLLVIFFLYHHIVNFIKMWKWLLYKNLTSNMWEFIIV